MSPASPTPRLRPTAVPGVAAAALATLLGRQQESFEPFETQAASLLGTRHAVVVGSARAGLAAVLQQVGCQPGDEIIVPSYTAPCVPAFLRGLGYRLRIASVCPRRLVVTGETVTAALGPRTRAVIPTHVEGVTAPMAEIALRCPPAWRSLKTQRMPSVPRSMGGRSARSAGGAIHSFGKGKHVNTVFGGLVVTDDDAVVAAARAARDALPPPGRLRLVSLMAMELCMAAATHPRLYPLALHPLIRAFARAGVDLPTRLFEDDGREPLKKAGHRPPSALGALALRQLATFPAERTRRRRNADVLRRALAERGMRYQEANDPGDHPLFLTLLHPRREALRQTLLIEGLDTQPTWMRSIVDDDGRQDPVAEQAEREGTYLPLHTGADPDAVIAALDRALAHLPT